MHDERQEEVAEETEVPAEPPAGREEGGDAPRGPRVRLGAVVAIAVVVGLVAWALVGRDDDGDTAPATPTVTAPSEAGTGPIAVSQDGLATLSKAFKQPIYWMGPKAGFKYEFLRTDNGSDYVRYLPKGVEVGDKRPDFTLVATYPFPGSYEALKETAAGNEVSIPGGGIALVDQAYPQSVHISYPDVDYQIEVYDPSPEKSLQIARSGNVKPVE